MPRVRKFWTVTILQATYERTNDYRLTAAEKELLFYLSTQGSRNEPGMAAAWFGSFKAFCTKASVDMDYKQAVRAKKSLIAKGFLVELPRSLIATGWPGKGIGIPLFVVQALDGWVHDCVAARKADGVLKDPPLLTPICNPAQVREHQLKAMTDAQRKWFDSRPIAPAPGETDETIRKENELQKIEIEVLQETLNRALGKPKY